MTKKSLINLAKSIILKYAKPSRVYLYGSQISGEARVGSDIDIAYDDDDFRDNYLILDEIENIDTLIKIDVKNIAKSDIRFKNRVKSTGKVIYSATKKLRAEDGLYNFSKALERFADSVDRREEIKQSGYEDIYLDLVVKRFEFTFEMGWKALKRYLEYLGFEPKNPRATFKEGYAQEIITDETLWLSIIEQRNVSSHIYDEYEIKEILEKLELYKDAFISLKVKIEKGLN